MTIVVPHFNQKFDTANQALFIMSHLVLSSGAKTSPRGFETREMLGVQFLIKDSTQCIPHGMNRNFNDKLAAAEVLSILGGFADEKWMFTVAPRYRELVKGKMTGAYGPRLISQMPYLVEMLRKDPDSRQAVATIWNPATDTVVEHGDRPCTVYFHFLIREGGLVTMTRMRSQDAFLGLTYDLPMFSAVHLNMAKVLGVPPLCHVHSADSFHAYKRDFEKIEAITPPVEESSYVEMEALSFDEPLWSDGVAAQANLLAYGYDRWLHDLTPFEKWLRENSADARL